jgi:hypothetical protein
MTEGFQPGSAAAVDALEPGAIVSEFVLDADDVIVEVDAAWRHFAEANAAPELLDIVGKPLRAFISGRSTRALWADLMKSVRASGRPSDICYRCDSPRTRRAFVMRITSEDAGQLRLTSRVDELTACDTGALLDRHAPRTSEHVVVCSWCKDAQLDSQWVSLEELVARQGLLNATKVPEISHGMCDRCATRWRAGAP